MEWLGPEYKEFVVGFSDSTVHVFKAETTGQRSLRKTQAVMEECFRMELLSIERPVGYHYLIVKVTRKGASVDEGVRLENSINDGETSEVYIVKGHNKEFEEMIPLSRCMPN